MSQRTAWKTYPRRFALANFLLLIALLASPLVIVASAAPASAATAPSDDFNRADGALGSNWTAMSDGAMAISAQAVVGTKAANYSGSIRSGETYTSDQSSQLQLTGTQLSGSQWIGVGVRAQANGQNLYLGLYWWNAGNPVLMMFGRNNGTWAQLGATYASGPLPAGTQLQLSAVGSTLTFSQDGIARITATNTTLTGGAPAIMAYGTPTADNWQASGTTGGGGGPTTYTVGGTVSGLSGTVGLQNNGADNLTLTANGTFTFNNALATGATYTVTVTTNPTGQTCTVTNGTGTGTANVTNVAVTCTTNASSTATDDFNRADGALGSNWTAMSDGAMAISAQAVVGTKAANYSGSIRSGETYTSDQSSQLQLTGTQLSGSQWIGVGVRAQANGQNLYLGLYWWNAGNPVLMMFGRNNGTWAQLGATYASGPLPAGTQLQLSAVGSTLTFSQDGIARITATNTTLTGGAPAIMAYGTPTADNWQASGTTGGGGGPTTYTVGGTVSGLSGTVGLQNNGADNLTLTANGTFTFNNALATGATYTVTVTTNPTGQTCTVTNGTGTGTANVTNVAVTCTTNASSTATDDFNRADGALGSNWTAMSDGAMAISAQAVVGTKAANYSGSIRSGETYTSDQSSQLQLTGTQLSGSQWIGVGVRAQANGQNLYLGLYWWNAGNPVLMMFGRNNGTWAQLGATYASGPLPAGTQLQLSAVGSTLTFSQDGIARITATNTTLTGGAPAIMAYGTPTADNWQASGTTGGGGGPTTYTVGGTVSGLSGTVGLQNNGADNLTLTANGTFTFNNALATGATYTVTVTTNPTGQTCTVTNGTGTGTANVTNVAVTCTTNASSLNVQFVGTDANGVESYRVTSAANGPDPTTLRVLRPQHPAAGEAHNFLYALPVEALDGTDFGDPISTLAALDAQDQYNLTIVAPSFGATPWYADNPVNANIRFETFMASELQPWVQANLSTTDHEQNWLIGFSKSGFGAQDLILKHPDEFTLAASWDFPADMSTYAQYGGATDNYGTDANFQANYRLTQAFVDAHKAPFTIANRIWIGGYIDFQQDIVDYNALLTSEGISHTLGPVQVVPHRWDGGWVAGALAGLAQDGINLH